MGLVDPVHTATGEKGLETIPKDEVEILWIASKSKRKNADAGVLFPNFEFKQVPKNTTSVVYNVTHPKLGSDLNLETDLVKAATDAGMKFGPIK